MQCGLPNDQLRVGATHVQSCQHAVAPRLAQRAQNHMLRGLRSEVVILVRAFGRSLPTHTRHAVQQVAEQLHRAVADAPVVVEQACKGRRESLEKKKLKTNMHVCKRADLPPAWAAAA